MASKKTYYHVCVIDQNAWNADGSAITVMACGHKHRTLSAAHRCYEQKTRRLSDGMHSADWYHAQIRHSDGSTLTEDEKNKIDELQYAGC